MRVAALLLAAATLALSACGGGSSSTPQPEGTEGTQAAYPIQTFADLGREHLAPGATFDNYNSDPPTSGPHAPRAAPWGVSDVPLAKEVPVHNMEHGGVVVWYNCDGGPQPLDGAGCRRLQDQLAAIVEEAVDNDKEVLMTPYPAMEHRIALTAWQTLDAFDELDEARVRSFIATYERKFNPEHF